MSPTDERRSEELPSDSARHPSRYTIGDDNVVRNDVQTKLPAADPVRDLPHEEAKGGDVDCPNSVEPFEQWSTVRRAYTRG